MTRRNNPRSSSDQVSELTAGRLSVYLRCLNTLDAAGVKTISSQALAEQFQLNAAQIRKDLAYFGEFGVRGVGYYVKELKRHLRVILGLDRTVRVAILGAGNLGLALADYPGFRQEGFAIVALFDAERGKIGRRSAAACRFTASIIPTVGRDASTSTSPWWPCRPRRRRGWSTWRCRRGFAPCSISRPGTLKVPPGVKLKNVDLTVSMESLSFFLARGEADAEAVA